MQWSNMLGAMPSPTAPVKQHEAFLEETKSLLHPSNFQVALIVHKLDIDGIGKQVKICVFLMFMGNFVILSSHGEK